MHLRPSRQRHLSLHGFCDADWGVSIEDKKSISGYCVFLGNSIISWSSKKQSFVSRSSTEAEYRAIADVSAELLWVMSLMDELQCLVIKPAVVWSDNIGTGSLAMNLVYHSRTKHVEIVIHFVRDKVAAKKLDVRYVPTYEQTADSLTKALPHNRLLYLRNKLGVEEIPSSLKGRVKA